MTGPGTVVIGEGERIEADTVRRVAVDRARLDVTDGRLRRLGESRRACLEALADGRRVYGVTTGAGYQADVDLGADVQARHQASLLLGRAVGGPPYLDPAEGRAIAVARLADLLSVHVGVSPQLCRAVVDWLNDGYAPAVPAHGVGTAGEVQALAHAFQPLLGVGRVLAPDGTVVEAERALADRGVAPYAPGPKEGIALLAGAPAAAGLGVLAGDRVQRLAAALEVVAAASLDAADAPGDVHGLGPQELAGDEVLAVVLSRLRSLRGLADQPAPSGRQAPVSMRVAPVVAAHLRRTLARFEEDVDRSLGAVTDSPALVGDGFVPTAGFHALDVAAGFDAVRAALVRVGELACQRTHRLLDPRVTGLPAQLAVQEGGTGLVVVHKRAVAATAELRRLAAPVTVGLADTSLGQEDAQTFTFAAADALRRAEALTAEVAACELACALQAWWLRDREPPEGLAGIWEAARGRFVPVDADRPLGQQLDDLAALVSGGLAIDGRPDDDGERNP